MNRANINAKVRSLLAAEEQRKPGFQAHAERVSVYAVATGERLGLDPAHLIKLRLGAELGGLAGADPDLIELTADDKRSQEIIRLCRDFDRFRSGVGGDTAADDTKSAEWLDLEARIEFEPEIVDALLAVQVVIQPVGT